MDEAATVLASRMEAGALRRGRSDAATATRAPSLAVQTTRQNELVSPIFLNALMNWRWSLSDNRNEPSWVGRSRRLALRSPPWIKNPKRPLASASAASPVFGRIKTIPAEPNSAAE
jgi:hypothetical protein